MCAQIIDGKKIADSLKIKISEDVNFLKLSNITPGLAVIIIGDDEASKIYVRNKEKACESIGIYSEKYSLPQDVSEHTVLNLIDRLNQRDEINGILVQLPLPKYLDENKIINFISPDKDVDGFHPVNVGKIMIGQPGFISCTPQGILELINTTNVNLKGKECVIVGSSNIVGKPMAMLLINNGATVTICNVFTKDLKCHCKRADILIVAVGKKKLITHDMVKHGAIVIDVGINRTEEGTLCGDVDFDSVLNVAGYITPVPGGVGPMTIAMLLKNTVDSAKKFVLSKR